MTEMKELVPIKAQVSKLENQAESIVIATQEDYEHSADIVSKLKETGKLIKDKKESITKPLNESLRNVRDLFRPIEEQFEHAEALIKRKLLDYKQKKDAEAREKEAKIAAQAEKGTIKLETAERKMGEIERIETTTRGKIGEVQVRKVKKVRITNESLIPRHYLVPDMVAIRRDALAGMPILGIEVFEEELIAAR